jgi:hypothetical protein
MDAFDAWVRYLFDRPAGGSFDDAANDDPVVMAEWIRRLFGDAGTVLRPYSDDQVGRGLQVIVNGSHGGLIAALADRRVPVALRTTALRAIVTLFADVFAVRLPGDEQPAGTTLGDLCFMFWDVIALGPGDEDTKLDVLEDTLALNSVACQWAALHGLGHLHFTEPTHVPAIVDRWLRRHPNAPADLLAYARDAREGMVM